MPDYDLNLAEWLDSCRRSGALSWSTLTAVRSTRRGRSGEESTKLESKAEAGLLRSCARRSGDSVSGAGVLSSTRLSLVGMWVSPRNPTDFFGLPPGSSVLLLDLLFFIFYSNLNLGN